MLKQSNSSPLTGDWQDVELFWNPDNKKKYTGILMSHYLLW